MLKELLAPEAIILSDSAETAEDIIRRLGEKLYQGGYVNSDFVEAALRREAELPTGLLLEGPFHAAIPHTEVEYVLKPAVALATLSNPVIFQHMINPLEEVPVRLVFLLALEQPKSQVDMLQEVATILQNPAMLDKLIKASSVNDILTALSPSPQDIQ